MSPEAKKIPTNRAQENLVARQGYGGIFSNGEQSSQPLGTTWREINLLAAGLPLDSDIDDKTLEILADLNSQDFLGS